MDCDQNLKKPDKDISKKIDGDQNSGEHDKDIPKKVEESKEFCSTANLELFRKEFKEYRENEKKEEEDTNHMKEELA